jgi:hypothetical protein
MKLSQIKHQEDYKFLVTFENGEESVVDLRSLISNYVARNELKTAKIDQEWGCLEFKGGEVDIEPKTLYAYVQQQANRKK